LHEVESQSGALFPRVGPLQGEEAVKDPFPAIVGDPRTLIFYAQRQLVCFGLCGDGNSSAKGTEIDGILDDVGECPVK